MSVSSINSVSPYLTTPSVTSSVSSPVVASNDPGLAEQASALSTTSGIVATLGSTSSSDQVYDAAGLYNSIAQAGTSTNTSSTASSGTSSGTTTTPTAASAQQSLNSAILDTLPTSSSNTGFYDGTGVLQSASTTGTNLTANWASALQANPNLSRTVAADSYAQGIIGTLSVTA
jgi:hypothetical protein